MTELDTAAARRMGQRIAYAAIVIASLALTGCETASNILGTGPGPEPVAQPLPAPAKIANKVAIAPVVGAPDAVGRQIVETLASATEQRGVVIAKTKDERSDFVLRGYLVASKEKAIAKIAYIWDVTDPTGKRVNRITGEEVLPNPATREPWTLVTPDVTKRIADKTSASLAAWLQSQTAVAGAASAQPAGPAGVGGQPLPQPVAATAMPPPLAPVTPPPPATPVPAVATGPAPGPIAALPKGDVASLAPTVAGAPGDGNSTLAAALLKELRRNGVVAGEGRATSYRIVGRVVMGAPREGKQTIQIDWQVIDPTGKSLGTVSQKNEVPQSSLDGAWGQTADAAAAAAAQGILKLLPPVTRTQ
ncbi:MAG TPA: hypothetical protein PK264_08495 [Hyphomicrobiaceae bacterium]|nr:hypothetical protein [Hyphomicrobiaceae bacterium]